MTTNQPRHESPELGSAVRRQLRALVRRAAEGDTEALEQLAMLDADLATAKAVAVDLMNRGERMGRRGGYSFTELAAVLGTSRQAARQLVSGRGAWRLTQPDADWYRTPRAPR